MNHRISIHARKLIYFCYFKLNILVVSSYIPVGAKTYVKFVLKVHTSLRFQTLSRVKENIQIYIGRYLNMPKLTI